MPGPAAPPSGGPAPCGGVLRCPGASLLYHGGARLPEAGALAAEGQGQVPPKGRGVGRRTGGEMMGGCLDGLGWTGRLAGAWTLDRRVDGVTDRCTEHCLAPAGHPAQPSAEGLSAVVALPPLRLGWTAGLWSVLVTACLCVLDQRSWRRRRGGQCLSSDHSESEGSLLGPAFWHMGVWRVTVLSLRPPCHSARGGQASGPERGWPEGSALGPRSPVGLQRTASLRLVLL